MANKSKFFALAMTIVMVISIFATIAYVVKLWVLFFILSFYFVPLILVELVALFYKYEVEHYDVFAHKNTSYSGINKQNTNKFAAIVTMILKDKYVGLNISIAAICVGTLFLLELQNRGINTIPMIILFAAIFIIFFLEHLLTVLRIKKHYYGTTEGEAREIIKFIIERSDDDDFVEGIRNKKIKLFEDIEQELINVCVNPNEVKI